MTFTDDDLRILKKWGGTVNGLAFDDLPNGKIIALLARLEAAEKVIANFATENASPELSNAYIVWRKAAGK